MSWNNPESEGEDNEEEEINLTGRDGILFLVDCSKSMFDTTEVDAENDPRSMFRIAIECIESVMRNRIIMSDSDLVIQLLCLVRHS